MSAVLFYAFQSHTHRERERELSREMEARWAVTGGIIVVILIWGWRMLNWLWLRPKKLERLLREQGLQGNPYKLLVGDLKEFTKMQDEAMSKPMNLSDDIMPRVIPYVQDSVAKYGKISFIWVGPTPRVTLADPDLIKEAFNKMYDCQKALGNPLAKLLISGLISAEGEKWAKHRKIINPAFHLEKLKMMLPIFFKSCNNSISKLEGMLSWDGWCELDMWPFLQNLVSDGLAQAAFGSSFKEGKKIFELQKEQAELATKVMLGFYIPGGRFLPTTTNKRIKKIDIDVNALLTNLIKRREKAPKVGESTNNDLLGILLESNRKEVEEHGNSKSIRMSIEDVIEECKVFYFAGKDTTSALLVWTMIVLSRYPRWQARAREEVLQVFGNKKPDFDGLSQLKVVTMILYEVLRLYPPAKSAFPRIVQKDMKLGNLALPAGVELTMPIVWIHHNIEIWGDDAKVFNPERFSEGVLKATKNGKVSFLPFGWGPRVCIGQNFSLLQAKMAMIILLQHFSFELSPTYAHAPISVITLQPQYGAHIILRKVESNRKN